MPTPERNPMATEAGTTPVPPPSLNWGGRLLVGLVFAAGVAALVYLGLVLGMIVGVQRGVQVMENTPPKNLGLAPDLTGLFEGTFEFARWALGGAVVGLLGGVVAMWAACRYGVAPLFRRVPALRAA